MNTSGNTVLITGGTSGIGFEMAKSFLDAGNTVVICSRSEDRLAAAKEKLPKVHTRACDVSKEKDVEQLCEWMEEEFPQLNILINNAGVQHAVDFRRGVSALISDEDEICINLTAPIHLCAYFIPLLSKQKEAAIINVTSGLAFIPLAHAPIYCATKAALHSLTISLRHQLKDTKIKVFEIIPPTVDTDLDKGRRGSENRGIAASIIAGETLIALKDDIFEHAIGQAEGLRAASRDDPQGAFERMNKGR